MNDAKVVPVAKTEVADGFDSKTKYTFFARPVTMKQIDGYLPVRGTGRCRCGICQADGDCCGNWRALPALVHRLQHVILIEQRWICNV